MLLSAPPWLHPGLTYRSLEASLYREGLRVAKSRLAPAYHGVYDDAERVIILSTALPEAHLLANLAHESVHAWNGHSISQAEAVEARIDRLTARALINPREYVFWESELGGHAGGIAKALEQPLWLVEAFRASCRFNPLDLPRGLVF